MFKKSIWENLQLIENTLPNKSGNPDSPKNIIKLETSATTVPKV